MSERVIEHDLYGAVVSQPFVDKLYGQVCIYADKGESLGDIIIKNVDLSHFPRLIVDHGELFAALCDVAKDFAAYKKVTDGR